MSNTFELILILFNYFTLIFPPAGIFDVHTAGNDAFSCGSFNNKQGYQLLEAFNFAIEHINNRNGIFADRLRGITLGGVGIDSCQSPLRTSTLVSNIHSGTLPLSNGDEEVNMFKFSDETLFFC